MHRYAHTLMVYSDVPLRSYMHERIGTSQVTESWLIHSLVPMYRSIFCHLWCADTLIPVAMYQSIFFDFWFRFIYSYSDSDYRCCGLICHLCVFFLCCFSKFVFLFWLLMSSVMIFVFSNFFWLSFLWFVVQVAKGKLAWQGQLRQGLL
jgi:hypothetical protein